MPEKRMAVCSDKTNYCIEENPQDFFTVQLSGDSSKFRDFLLIFFIMTHFVTVYLNLVLYRQTQPEYAV